MALGLGARARVTLDLATLLLTIITLFIAAGGGIGGGAVFIVCYVFVGGFTPAQAVALSNITILGGSLANFIANSSRRHPMLDRPLIDWDLILVMEPTTMLGALLGGYLNKLFPVWLTSCLLAARSAAAAAGSQAAAAAAAAAGNGSSSSSSVAFGGIHWTPRNSLLYPALCSTAGVVAGLFGVGGGIVKGPLMLELGVCPEVAAATSATMIAFTAGSAAVVYVNFGGVVHDYALALLAVGFVITLLGQLVTIRLVKALGRRSVIIFMMGGLMVLASGAAGYQSVVSVAAALHDPRGMWAWGSVCKHH
ncbi:hypothetical protein OEZ85_012240 [Tetradesmus obliquus]|uniref:Membrane transporter protein n=1 Tax=Tetradesmus obliquus TaxID=3088 RepID=A0ABY8TXH2_TETOB|nr:hypothetical protein OEZ85_012240 [Tetradesmus obliquus]